MRRAARVLFLLLAPQIAPLSVAFVVGIHKSITHAVLSGMSPPFNALAMGEVEDANFCVDLGIELFSDGDEMDKPCVPAWKVSYQMADVQIFGPPENHFDDEEFLKGAARLRTLKVRVVEYAQRGQFIESRKVLGMALHTIQDFYAHSNWVELGSRDILAALDTVDAPIPQSRSAVGDPRSGSWRLAGPKEDVCKYSVNLLGVKTPTEALIPGKTMAGAQPGYVLTSGYYLTPGPRPVDIKLVKCRHGSAPDLGVDGINKDTKSTQHGEMTFPDERTFFQEAQRLAALHTRAFVQYVFDKLKDNQAALAGLTGTEPTDCYCSHPVTEHIHDPGRVDVNAEKWNYAGLTVKAGDVIKFDVNPKGEIVWGRTYSLFGEELVARPQGDASASSQNHVGWITPPLPKYPVGMLIGLVLLQGTGTEVQTVPFAVGLGLSPVKMPASGELYLTVNDAVLSNNRGCFQTRVTRLP